jgi:hypothetical protein
MTEFHDSQGFQEFNDGTSNPWGNDCGNSYGNVSGNANVTSESYEVNADDVTEGDAANSDRHENGTPKPVAAEDFEPSEPITQKELADFLGKKRPYISRIVAELKSYFPESNLYEGRKISTFAQEQVCDFISMGAEKYRKSIEEATNTVHGDRQQPSSGAIARYQRAKVPAIDPEILSGDALDPSSLTDRLAIAQSSQGRAMQSMENAAQHSQNTEALMQTFFSAQIQNARALAAEVTSQQIEQYEKVSQSMWEAYLSKLGKPSSGYDDNGNQWQQSE